MILACRKVRAREPWDWREGRRRTCASFSSLIGMPIVLVMMSRDDPPVPKLSSERYGWCENRRKARLSCLLAVV